MNKVHKINFSRHLSKEKANYKNYILARNDKKVKQFHYRPGLAQRVPTS